MSIRFSRRGFLRMAGSAAAALTAAACKPFVGGTRPNPPPVTEQLPMRALGSTGQSVSLLGLGGQSAIEGLSRPTAVEIINYAIDNGVNYIDTSPRYGGGRRERNIGEVMRTRRREVFLATKSREKTFKKVMDQFEESRNRLNTDYIDLYQVHNIGEPSDVSELFEKDSEGRTAINAFERLRDAGKVGSIGITGHHDPEQLLAVLNHPEAPAFDAVLMALNPADWHRRTFQDELFSTVLERKMAIIAMKVTGLTYLFSDIPDMADCLKYVYSLPISCAVVGISDLSELQQNLQITADFSEPLSKSEMQALEDSTRATPDSGSPRRGDYFKVDRVG